MVDKVGIRRAVVASQIREALARRGMTRKQLADALGRRPSEVTKWLGGNHNFTIDLLSEISEAVGEQITGVVSDDCGRMVDGFSGKEGSGVLRDSGVGFYSVGPIVLPVDCFHSLERRALQRGEELGAYVKGVLVKEASRSVVNVWDFCGIWKEEDFGMSVEEQIADLRSHRSVHKEVEEL